MPHSCANNVTHTPTYLSPCPSNCTIRHFSENGSARQLLSIVISIGRSPSTTVAPYFLCFFVKFSFQVYIISEIGSARQLLSIVISIGLSPSTSAALHYRDFELLSIVISIGLSPSTTVDPCFVVGIFEFFFPVVFHFGNWQRAPTSLDPDFNRSISQHDGSTLFLFWSSFLSCFFLSVTTLIFLRKTLAFSRFWFTSVYLPVQLWPPVFNIVNVYFFNFLLTLTTFIFLRKTAARANFYRWCFQVSCCICELVYVWVSVCVGFFFWHQ